MENRRKPGSRNLSPLWPISDIFTFFFSKHPDPLETVTWGFWGGSTHAKMPLWALKRSKKIQNPCSIGSKKAQITHFCLAWVGKRAATHDPFPGLFPPFFGCFWTPLTHYATWPFHPYWPPLIFRFRGRSAWPEIGDLLTGHTAGVRKTIFRPQNLKSKKFLFQKCSSNTLKKKYGSGFSIFDPYFMIWLS